MSCFTPFRARILVDYPPNDKERIVVPSCQYHRCLLLTLSMLTSRLRGVIWMHDFKELLYRCTTPYIQTKYQKRKSAFTLS